MLLVWRLARLGRSVRQLVTLCRFLPKYERLWGRHATEEKHLRICEYSLAEEA